MAQQYVPREHQQLIIDTIIDSKSCNIWSDPGTGKTSSVLAALDMLWLTGSAFHPALVIAPKRVARDVWHTEVEKWSDFNHLRVSRIMGSKAERLKALRQDADIYTINYENVQWLVEELNKDWFFRIVVADESTRLQNFRLRRGGRRAGALAKIRKGVGRWINLTGSPAPSGLLGLWGQQWFVDRGERLCYTFTKFKERWFYENPYSGKVEPQPFAQDQITRAIEDVTVSIRAKDYFDLEEPHENTITVSLPSKARRMYDDMETALFAKIDEEGSGVTAANSGVRTMKCLQIAAGAVYNEDGDWEFVHDAKLDALRSLVNDMNGNPLLCAYHWEHDRDRILQAFPEQARVLSTEQDMQDWRDGKITLGVAHPASIGHGLNLAEGGHHIVFFSHWWDYEQFQQIIERIGPMRQKQLGREVPVFIHYIVAEDTLDEMVLERRRSKRSVEELLRSRLSAKRSDTLTG